MIRGKRYMGKEKALLVAVDWDEWGSTELVIEPPRIGVTIFLVSGFVRKVFTNNKSIADQVKEYFPRVTVTTEKQFLGDLDSIKHNSDSDFMFIKPMESENDPRWQVCIYYK